MPRASDSTTDTHLDVLRTLGVTDAALRRHHDAAPETPLRVAIDGDRGAPTADLLSALGATGRVLDVRDGLAAGDGDRLTAALGRFGYAIECTAADDVDESDDLELRVRDVVTGDDESLRTAPDAAVVEATLRDDLLAPLDVELAELLDGRHLVAEARELRALAARYGDRIEPFDDPLLVPEAAIDLDDEAPSGGLATGRGDSPSVGAVWGADASAERTPSVDPSESGGAPPEDAPATDDGESFGEALAEADDATTDSIEDALSRGGPSTHTIESDDDLAAASETTVGGGPRRTVSTTGIDEVFDQLESSAAEADSARDDHDAADSRTAARTATSDSSDPAIDASAPGDDTGEPAEGLSGGPKRTVSTTSADDILARATGERDFEAIAAAEGDADPDAVLAEGDVPPALEDSGVTPALSSGTADAAADDESGAAAGDASLDPDEAVGTAERPPADPAAATSADETISSTGDGAGDGTADDVLAAAGAGAGGSDEPPASTDDDADSSAADGDLRTPMPPAGDADQGGRDSTDDADATPDPADLGGELLGDDVELRDGSESVDGPAASGDDPVGTGGDADESAAADGPLAASGGLRPDDGSSEPESAGDPAADDATSDDHRPADDATFDDRRPADATRGAPARDDSTTRTAATDDPTSNRETAATDEDPDADAVAEDDSADDGGDAGLVGRITSTIFGR